VKVDQGALLSVAVSKTLTLNGPFDAGLYQTFSGSGTVTLGKKVKEAYPEWWGADNTGATSATTAFTAWAASGCLNLKLAPGATYKIKNVALPKVNNFHLDGNHANIIADGTNGDAAASCFTVTFDDNTGTEANWYHFWTFENFVLSSGYLSDFLVVNLQNKALVTDLMVRNIWAKGGIYGTGDPANAILKIVNTSTMTSESFTVDNIQVNGGSTFDHVVHVNQDSTAKSLSGSHFSNIFHSVFTDGLAKTIYNDGTFGRCEFRMIYSAGGHIIETYYAQDCVFDRIYQESLVNQDSTAVAIVGNAASMAFQNCEFKHIRNVRSVTYGDLHEKLFTGSCYNCSFSNLLHNTAGASLDYATVVISGATSSGNWIGDLWSTGDSDTQYWAGVSDAGTGTKYGHAEKIITGTWTPTLVGLTTAGTFALAASYNTGYYKRVGDVVYISGLLKVGSVSGSPAGSLSISLPYTVATGAQYSAGIALASTTLAAGISTYHIFAYAEATNKYITVHGVNAGAYVSIAEFFTADALIRFSGSYVAKSDGT
jgi:hypothetical protein